MFLNCLSLSECVFPDHLIDRIKTHREETIKKEATILYFPAKDKSHARNMETILINKLSRQFEMFSEHDGNHKVTI